MRAKHARLIRQGITLARLPIWMRGFAAAYADQPLVMRAYWRTRDRKRGGSR